MGAGRARRLTSGGARPNPRYGEDDQGRRRKAGRLPPLGDDNRRGISALSRRSLMHRAARVVETNFSTLTGGAQRAKIGSAGQSRAAWRRSTAVWKP